MGVPFREYWRLLARYLHPYRRHLALLAVLVCGGIAVRLLAPWLAGWFLDDVTGVDPAPGGDRLTRLTVLASLFCVAGVADQLFAVASSHLGSHIAWTATNRLREDVVEHCLRLDLSFHHDHGPGVMVERVDGDVRELNNFFSQFALRLVANLLLVVGAVVVVLWVDWRMGVVFVALVATTLWLFRQLHGRAAPSWRRARACHAALYGEVEERLGGLPDIRANGADGYVYRRFAEALRNVFHRNRTASSVSALVGTSMNLALVLGGTVVLAVAVALHLAGTLSVGAVVAMSMYMAIITTPLRQILAEIDDLQRATASIDRVRELLTTRPTVESGPGAAWPAGPLALAVENVSFAYPSGADRPPDVLSSPALVLREVSFRLRPGEVLGVIGRTGAGKSTLVRLLLRFYDPTSGRIALDDVDLRHATLAELRTHVGVVTQEVQLFHTTVRDNLTLFDDRISDERLIPVLRSVGLGAWLARQPRGLDTVLASGGGDMSAGEAQLLGVARVLLTDPGVVILDEPTSRLDDATAALVDRTLDRLLARRTGVIVAHRLHTVRRADTILMLEHGRIAEHGPRAELAADPDSAYHRALVVGGDLDQLSPPEGSR